MYDLVDFSLTCKWVDNPDRLVSRSSDLSGEGGKFSLKFAHFALRKTEKGPPSGSL